jgi:hypothetical protein
LDITKTIKLKYPEIYKNFNKTDVDIIEFSSFITNKKKILIIGNSHAADLYSTLKLLENRVNNLEFGYYRFQNILQIENFSKKNIYRNADIIIYAKRYDMSTEDELIQLEKLIEKIDRKKKFILINNSPHFYTSNLTIVEYSLLRNNLKKTQAKKDIIDSINETSYYLLSEKINNINNKLKIFAEKNNLIFYDSFDLFCELQKKLCYVIDEDFNQLYRDYGHLTKKGTIFFSKKIEETKWLIKSLF